MRAAPIPLLRRARVLSEQGFYDAVKKVNPGAKLQAYAPI